MVPVLGHFNKTLVAWARRKYERLQRHKTRASRFEDDRPWIEADPHGMPAVLLLRRIAYTLLALYRAVTLRSDKGCATPWKERLEPGRADW